MGQREWSSLRGWMGGGGRGLCGVGAAGVRQVSRFDKQSYLPVHVVATASVIRPQYAPVALLRRFLPTAKDIAGRTLFFLEHPQEALINSESFSYIPADYIS